MLAPLTGAGGLRERCWRLLVQDRCVVFEWACTIHCMLVDLPQVKLPLHACSFLPPLLLCPHPPPATPANGISPLRFPSAAVVVHSPLCWAVFSTSCSPPASHHTLAHWAQASTVRSWLRSSFQQHNRALQIDACMCCFHPRAQPDVCVSVAGHCQRATPRTVHFSCISPTCLLHVCLSVCLSKSIQNQVLVAQAAPTWE